MITEEMYMEYLGANSLSEARRKSSARIVNAAFKGDVGYKRVYLLDPKEGWIWVDANYSKHTTESILKDAVDYYLQFRPNEHHPIGTYVFIPDDASSEVGFYQESPPDPFKDENFENVFNEGKLWLIVGKNNAIQFVRYNILQCNWDFKWMAKKGGKRQLMHIYGMNRMRNSYTSGTYMRDYINILDSVNAAWIPDTYYVYKDKINEYGLSDTRYLFLDVRMMLTNNAIHPQCFSVSKVEDLDPAGIIKITAKLDEYDPKRDNVSLSVCDYYSDSGDIQIEDMLNQEGKDSLRQSRIFWGKMNENEELEKAIEPEDTTLHLGKTSYLLAEFSDKSVVSEWILKLSSDNEEDLKKENYYVNLLSLQKIDETTISLRPRKANSLIGKKFTLIVQDKNGEYKSSIELEVAK